MSGVAKTVDEYIAAAPAGSRAALEVLRATIRSAAPKAVESITYQIPTYKYDGQRVIYFGTAKTHVAVYGAPMAAHQRELASYSTSKGTIRFPFDQPIPKALVKKLVKTRLGEIEARKKAK